MDAQNLTTGEMDAKIADARHGNSDVADIIQLIATQSKESRSSSSNVSEAASQMDDLAGKLNVLMQRFKQSTDSDQSTSKAA